MKDPKQKKEKKEIKIPGGIWVTIIVVLALVFAVSTAAVVVAEPWAGIPAFDFYTGPDELPAQTVTLTVGESVDIAPEMTDNEEVKSISVSDEDILSNDGLTLTALGDYDGASMTVTTKEKQVPTIEPKKVSIFGADITESYNSVRAWLRQFMRLEGTIKPRTELRDLCVYTYNVTVDGCDMQHNENQLRLIVGQAKGVISIDDGLDHEIENENEAVVETNMITGRVQLTPLAEGKSAVTVYSGFYKQLDNGEKVFVATRACEYGVEVLSGSGQAPYTSGSAGGGGNQGGSTGSSSAAASQGGSSSSGGGSSTGTGSGDSYVYSNNYAAGSEMLNLVNEARAVAGVAPLTWSSTLADCAAIRSREAAVSFSHTRPDGRPWYTVSDLAHGENLAAGYSTAVSAMAGLMDSPGHRENILREKFTTMGACMCSTDAPGYKYYWCQLFG